MQSLLILKAIFLIIKTPLKVQSPDLATYSKSVIPPRFRCFIIIFQFVILVDLLNFINFKVTI